MEKKTTTIDKRTLPGERLSGSTNDLRVPSITVTESFMSLFDENKGLLRVVKDQNLILSDRI